MVEITTVEQLASLCTNLKQDYHYRLYQIELPVYCAQVPANLNKGREREIIRKQRMAWYNERVDRSLLNRAHQFVFYYMHFNGNFIFNDFATALEFQLTFI